MKTIERQIIEKQDELIKWLREMGYGDGEYPYNAELESELASLKSQLKDDKSEVKTAEEILEKYPNFCYEPKLKSVLVYLKNDIIAAMNEYASQFQEQPITVTDEMIEKAMDKEGLTTAWDRTNGKRMVKWALSLKAQKAQPSDEDIKEWAKQSGNLFADERLEKIAVKSRIEGAIAMRDGLIPAKDKK